MMLYIYWQIKITLIDYNPNKNNGLIDIPYNSEISSLSVASFYLFFLFSLHLFLSLRFLPTQSFIFFLFILSAFLSFRFHSFFFWVIISNRKGKRYYIHQVLMAVNVRYVHPLRRPTWLFLIWLKENKAKAYVPTTTK
jgi:hypothetical protein